jgi:peroxiredoxin Q/BCP
LFFYPADFTPNSAKQLLEYTKGLPQLEAAGIKLYGVTTGTLDAHREFVQKYGITIPILVDTGTIARSYGVMLDEGQYPQRTLVGIEPDGTVGFYQRAFAHMHLVDGTLKLAGRTAPKPASAGK